LFQEQKSKKKEISNSCPFPYAEKQQLSKLEGTAFASTFDTSKKNKNTYRK